MKRFLWILILFPLILFAETHIPAGPVSGTWDFAGSPYLIDGEIEIPNGQTLIIDPGCLIEFQGHYKFNVQGRLLAVGTEQDSIRFTVADTTGFSNFNSTDGGWHGIRLENTPATNDSSKIIYCILENGKAMGDVPEDRKGGGIYIFDYSKIEFSNNLIQNNYSEAFGGGMLVFNSEMVIKNTKICNNFNYGIYGLGSKIENCIVSNNLGGGICGIDTIKNSKIFDNQDVGIESCELLISSEVYDNLYGIESFWQNCSVINSLIYNNNIGMVFWDDECYVNCVISNCTFANNVSGLNVDGMGQWNATDVIITNSIFFNDDDFHLIGYGITATASYCLFSEEPTGFSSLQHMLYSDPSFVDPANNDFHLESYSPCLNNGTPDTTGLNLPEYDLDGNPRIYQGTYPIIDLGCYEYQDDPSQFPAITIQNDNIEFENWSPTSGNSPSQEFIIFNTGMENLSITSIESPDGFLIRQSGTYVQSLPGFELLPATNSQIEVVFAPSSTGMYSDEIHIYSNAVNGSDATVQVSGESDDDYHIAANILSDTIWDYDTVIVHNNISVYQGINLEILPGTTIKFNYCSMDIYGNLIAEGEEDNIITFTGNTIWKGIRIISPNEAPIIEFCKFEKVRNNSGNLVTLYLNDCPNTVVSNSIFYDNRNVTAPACLNITDTNVEINNCLFDSNVSSHYEYNYGQPPWGGEEAAIKTVNCTVSINSSKFVNNYSGWGDGGSQSIINCESNIENLKIINSLFGNNSSACLISSNAGLEFTNCVSGADQGYIFYWEYLSVINSILWNDDETFLNVWHYGTVADILHSDIRGGQNAFYQNNTINWLEGNISSDPLFIDPDNGDYRLLADSPCINAGTPDTTGLNLPAYDLDGNPRIYDGTIDMGCYEWQGTPINSEELPVVSYGLSNFPNPFNPSTTIEFNLPQNYESAKIEIYNIIGQRVKSLPVILSDAQHRIEGSGTPNNYSVVWNGSDSNNKLVSSGIYFYQLNVDGKVKKTKKMMLIK
ncbi:MAG: hypothetical protein K9N09_06300 [Candidatus Cloacimonetes bacterium]|nr:hypothetical protein [Candidatus Cloacimonadota bacterium]MCF7813858.1 hypothetical protein [Candidatus Cloacimonadota bacterium]MCF7868296.1 hypothetical protein [Candidatus Cloacimonadota bacterium]MCF7883730.1 hypothetical protein [Candidatus Cloacimonadota bacterium]